MDDQSPQSRKWIARWVLAASLGLNLLFIGAFAGAAFRHTGAAVRSGDVGPSLRGGYATPYVQALPREKRRALFRSLRKESSGAAPLSKKARRALYEQMVSVLRTSPFDPAAAQQILAVQRDVVLGVQSAAQSAWLEEVTEMAPNERADYADALQDVLGRGPRWRDPGKRRND